MNSKRLQVALLGFAAITFILLGIVVGLALSRQSQPTPIVVQQPPPATPPQPDFTKEQASIDNVQEIAIRTEDRLKDLHNANQLFDPEKVTPHLPSLHSAARDAIDALEKGIDDASLYLPEKMANTIDGWKDNKRAFVQWLNEETEVARRNATLAIASGIAGGLSPEESALRLANSGWSAEFLKTPLEVAKIAANIVYDPAVTRERYDEVREGMTYAAVTEIFGRDGEPCRSPGANLAQYWMDWKNSDGSLATILFEHDTVRSKLESGLR